MLHRILHLIQYTATCGREKSLRIGGCPSACQPSSVRVAIGSAPGRATAMGGTATTGRYETGDGCGVLGKSAPHLPILARAPVSAEGGAGGSGDLAPVRVHVGLQIARRRPVGTTAVEVLEHGMGVDEQRSVALERPSGPAWPRTSGPPRVKAVGPLWVRTHGPAQPGS